MIRTTAQTLVGAAVGPLSALLQDLSVKVNELVAERTNSLGRIDALETESRKHLDDICRLKKKIADQNKQADRTKLNFTACNHLKPKTEWCGDTD